MHKMKHKVVPEFSVPKHMTYIASFSATEAEISAASTIAQNLIWVKKDNFQPGKQVLIVIDQTFTTDISKYFLQWFDRTCWFPSLA